MDKKSFIIYLDDAAVLDALDDEQRGVLFFAMYHYAMGEDVSPIIDDTAILALFRLFAKKIDRDRKKYEEVCQKARESINARYNKK